MDPLLELAPCLYFACTDDGTLVAANDYFCTRLGYSMNEVTGQKLDDLLPVASRIFRQTHFYPLLRLHGHAEEIYFGLRTKEGQSVPVLINAVRQEDASGTGLIRHAGIVVQHREQFEQELIAARKAAETALQENTALQQAKASLQQHLEELDRQIQLVSRQHHELRQFSRIITHDLQEPLRKLGLFCNLLQEEADGGSAGDTAGKVLRVAGQLRSLVSGLQQFVWLTDAAHQPAPVPLGPLLQEVAAALRQTYPGITLIVEAPPLPTVTADPDQMRLLLQHLLDNAIRFRKPGEAVHVTVRSDELLRNTFNNLQDQYRYAGFLKMEVSDKGMGFDDTYSDQAFELFRRLHAESGRGVGLSLCKKIMENHRGRISLRSRPGEGTTVTVWLPLEVFPAISPNAALPSMENKSPHAT
ncbi:MAG TPA: ATP-binding protein [Chitinophagaceae bacterium]|jgi:sigma-B regulation protein RsbU (phosphoserine phosphatase)|nr:ATP-binding protein [Chitinophagaceae bacterium]